MAVEVIVEYEVLEGMEEEADDVRAAFLDGVASWRPASLKYRVMRKGPEGRRFVHLAWVESPEVQQELFATQFFKDFDAGMQRISGGTVQATPLFAWSPS